MMSAPKTVDGALRGRAHLGSVLEVGRGCSSTVRTHIGPPSLEQEIVQPRSDAGMRGVLDYLPPDDTRLVSDLGQGSRNGRATLEREHRAEPLIVLRQILRVEPKSIRKPLPDLLFGVLADHRRDDLMLPIEVSRGRIDDGC